MAFFFDALGPTAGVAMRGVPALVLLAVLSWPNAVSADLSWPLSDYNPRPLPDDLLLPLPCGGAMAFRPVPTGEPPGGKANLPPGLHWLLDVQGSFPGADGQGAYFLMGKYEVNARQYRAVRAAADGQPCPAVAAATSALPMKRYGLLLNFNVPVMKQCIRRLLNG